MYEYIAKYVGDVSSVSVVVDKNNNSITAIADLEGVFRVVNGNYIEGKH